MELGLKDKTVIVTGGASNIGRTICFAFAREGANVVMAEIDEKQGQKVADQIKAEGGKIIVIKTDVTDLDSVRAMVKQTLDQFGRIDVLVNNVGWDNLMLFTETTPEFWDKIMALNYRSDLNCISAVLPHMIERKSGNIVSISSDAGRMGEFREAVYSGCKAGVIGLSKSIAREVGRYGVRLNVVCPGLTIPESSEDIGEKSMHHETLKLFTSEVQEKAAKGYPLRRLGKPQEVANAVVFLASDAAGYITGQTLSVSGGYTMM
jgi:NAD(P)-dependent dehydrogenase (short-subunit alcohol dehydrogenase family)